MKPVKLLKATSRRYGAPIHLSNYARGKGGRYIELDANEVKEHDCPTKPNFIWSELKPKSS